MATAKPKFRSAYTEPIRFYMPTGDGTEKTYGYGTNAKGQKILQQTGEKNLYEEIQSYHEDTKIENILARAAVGDMSDFRPQGIYQDISNIPTNLIDAKREITKLENLWRDTPKEIKAKYDWSLDSFIAKAGEKSWLIDMGFIQPEAPEAPVTITETPTTIETPKEVK